MHLIGWNLSVLKPPFWRCFTDWCFHIGFVLVRPPEVNWPARAAAMTPTVRSSAVGRRSRDRMQLSATNPPLLAPASGRIPSPTKCEMWVSLMQIAACFWLAKMRYISIWMLPICSLLWQPLICAFALRHPTLSLPSHLSNCSGPRRCNKPFTKTSYRYTPVLSSFWVGLLGVTIYSCFRQAYISWERSILDELRSKPASNILWCQPKWRYFGPIEAYCACVHHL
jgi:hypothetical protein